MPGQPYVLRAAPSTDVSSTNTIPAPPMANLPRCTRCQSVGAPSLARYCDIGDTTTRLRATRPRSPIGVKSSGVEFGVRAVMVCFRSLRLGAVQLHREPRHHHFLEDARVGPA